MAQHDYRAASQALGTLLDATWPGSGAEPLLAALGDATDVDGFRATLGEIFGAVHASFPGAHLWWKDEHSHFLGACPNLLKASTLDEATLLSGIDDHDPRLPWTRQAALYVKDDREVFVAQQAKLNIVERQDQVDGTVWLKTSKVPYRNPDGTGGTVGGFEVIDEKAAWKLKRAADA